MRLPRSRFTIRRLMVGVAIVGLAVAAIPAYLRVVARGHRAFASEHRRLANLLREEGGGPSGGRNAARGGHHVAMAAKYERAALRPWRSVPPGPPPPAIPPMPRPRLSERRAIELARA